MNRTNRNKDATPMPGGTSGSTPFDTARRPVPPPVSASDIPHPLGNLPPEVVGRSRPGHNNPSVENFAEDDGTRLGVVSVPQVIKRQSGAAKKRAPRR
jgi:hypothetical protein